MRKLKKTVNNAVYFASTTVATTVALTTNIEFKVIMVWLLFFIVTFGFAFDKRYDNLF